MRKILYNLIIASVLTQIYFVSTATSDSTREKISLNGEWELIFQHNENLPEDSKWSEKEKTKKIKYDEFTGLIGLEISKCINVNVPGYITGYNDAYALFRKNVVIPLSMKGKKIYLNFGAVKWSSKIFLNKEKIGEHIGGFEQFEIDITDKCKLGEINEIIVLVGNRFTVSDKETEKVIVPTAWHGDINYHGIWEYVEVTTYPDIYIEDVFVIPSFRKKDITLQITLKNTKNSKESFTIMNTAYSKKDEKKFEQLKAELSAGETKIIEIKSVWENPVLWWPHSPYLYQLKTELKDNNGKIIDEKITNFGFREFWIEGNQFRFNGKRKNLKGAHVYFVDIPNHLKKETVLETYKILKQSNIDIVRLQGQPFPVIWYDIADEMGILILEESALHQGMAAKIDDDRLWKNTEIHTKAMIKRSRNHPSVIIYDLSNEIAGKLFKFPNVTKEELKKKLDYLWKKAKEVDSTRPMMHEDAWLYNAKEIENIHYPREYVNDLNMGGMNYQYPNVAYWFNPNKKQSLHLHPDKPYFIGETLWEPSATPDGDTIFLGDDAYVNTPRGAGGSDEEAYKEISSSKEKAKSIAWEIQLKAYRYTEVPAVSPFSLFYDAHLRKFDNKEFPMTTLAKAAKKAFEPIAAFITEYGKNFFSGEKAEREITVYNDTLIDSKIRFECNLFFENKKFESSGKEIFIEAGYSKKFKISFTAPEVNERKELQLDLKLYQGNDLVFSDFKKYSVFPKKKLSLSKKLRIALYDRKGLMGKFLRTNGLNFLSLKELFEIPEDIDLLIIAPESFITYPGTFARIVKENLENFVKKGGMLLILRQELYPEELFKVTMTDHSPTIAFPLARGNPVLNNIDQDDLMFWRDDNFVSGKDFKKPCSGNIRSLVDSGGVGGLIYSPMVEILMGNGKAILSQMMIAEKYDREPVTNLILQNILNYLSSAPVPPKPAGLISQDNFFEQKLKSLEVKYENISKKLDTADFSKFSSLLIHKDTSELLKNESKIKKYLNDGGNVLICGIKESDWINIKPFIPQELSLKAAKDFHVIINKSQKMDPLIAGISNQDFYWLDNKGSPGLGRPTPLFKEIADFVLVRKNSLDTQAPVVFLSQPGALVKIPYGKGALIIDQINWERIEPNNQNWEKAKRYITTLLTNLGVDFY